MSEPEVAVVERGEPDRVAGSAPSIRVRGVGRADSADAESARSACRSLVVFGVWAGRSLAFLGILKGAVSLVELAGAGPAGPSGPALWARACLHALFTVLAFTMAGWSIRALSRFIATVTLGFLERVDQVLDDLKTHASELLARLEQIAKGQAHYPGPILTSSPSGLDRARSMAEIVRAAEAGDWVEAETRLNDFEAGFPHDPAFSSLKDELAKSRNARVKNGLERLEAARAASDADRVLEIYQDLVPLLDDERRATVDPDLARWFLGLIHRRLRVGKVQADVVQLASRFAETFATTVEGASVRASLPTLRRSVGLCPRCAQPYVGVADACPNCKKGAATHAPSAPPPPADADGAQ